MFSLPTTISIKRLSFALKIALVVAVLYMIQRKANFDYTFDTLFSFAGLKATALGFIFIFAQYVLGAYRLYLIQFLVSKKIRLWECIKITFIGAFFSNTLISFLSGDFIKTVLLNRNGFKINNATLIIISDRLIGLASLTLLSICSLSLLQNLNINFHLPINKMIAISICALILIFSLIILARKKISTLLNFILNQTYNENFYKTVVSSIIIGIAIWFLNIILIYIIMHYFQVGASFLTCLILVPIVLFISMLPISFSGWGVREGGMIYLFGLLGHPADKIFAVSITFGLVLTISSLPGSIYFILPQNNKIKTRALSS